MTTTLGNLPAIVQDFNAFRAKGVVASAPYDQLPEEDVLALLHANLPITYEKLGVYEKAGWLKFIGNQHNEKWEWTSEWLGLLKRGNALVSFLVFVKADRKQSPHAARKA